MPRPPKYSDPERQRIEKPDPDLIEEGRCGRWKAHEKAKAIERYEAGEPYEAEGRCRIKVDPKGSACKRHGGKSLAGPVHPRYIDGRYCKYELPISIKETVQKALQNPELLEVSTEVALVDSRIQTLLDKMDSGESREAWQRMRAALGQLRMAFAAGDQQAIRVAVGQMHQVISAGENNYAVWDDIYEAMGQKKSLIETERRRIEAEAAYMSADTANMLILTIVDLVRKYMQPSNYSEFAKELYRATGMVDVTPPEQISG